MSNSRDQGMTAVVMRYVFAAGIPALVNFASITVYTRLLQPAQYGHYALALAYAASINALMFQWIRSGVRRYLPDAAQHAAVLRSARTTYLALFALLATLGAIAMLVAGSSTWLVAAAIGITLPQAWFELNQEVAIAGLSPWRFGLAAFAKSTAALLVAIVMIRAGFGWAGPACGLMVGFGLPALWNSGWVGEISTRGPTVYRMLWRYGAPLTASYALQFLLDSSDRILLAVFASAAAVGAYAAAYDMISQTLTLLFMMVNLAAFPIALRALSVGGRQQADVHLARQAVLLAAIGLPAALALVVLAPAIARVMLGVQFTESATMLIPVVAAGVFFAGAKAFYFDLAFQLGERTRGIIEVGAIAAAANVGLNLWAIPRYGAIGAAWTTVIAFVLGCLLSALRGRAIYRLPLPWRGWLRVAVASAVMAIAIWPMRTFDAPVQLAGAIAAGLAIYAGAAIALDAADSRRMLFAVLARRSG